MPADKLMNIFLTGGTNSGKSWLIDSFVKEYKGNVGGYRTLLKKTQIDDLCGIYLLDINSPKEPLTLLNRIGSCTPQKQPIGYPEVFETAGVRTLSFKSWPDLIILDEIGSLEEDSIHFKHCVIDCIEASSNLLGVLKKKNSDFLDSIRARNDIFIIDLDISSKNYAMRMLKEYLC